MIKSVFIPISCTREAGRCRNSGVDSWRHRATINNRPGLAPNQVRVTVVAVTADTPTTAGAPHHQTAVVVAAALADRETV